MLTNSMTKLIQDRWHSDCTFSGHTSESLLRKIRCAAVSEAVQKKARYELNIRAQVEIPTLGLAQLG